MANIITADARRELGRILDSLVVARSTDDFERERVFLIWAVQYVESLKRAHNTNDHVTASRIEGFLVKRDYAAAVQVWEGRR